MGTAEKHVLAWFASESLPSEPMSWSRVDGFAVYENREFTERLCVALTARGYLDEQFASSTTRYTLNKAGQRAVREFSVPAPRTGR